MWMCRMCSVVTSAWIPMYVHGTHPTGVMYVSIVIDQFECVAGNKLNCIQEHYRRYMSQQKKKHLPISNCACKQITKNIWFVCTVWVTSPSFLSTSSSASLSNAHVSFPLHISYAPETESIHTPQPPAVFSCTAHFGMHRASDSVSDIRRHASLLKWRGRLHSHQCSCLHSCVCHLLAVYFCWWRRALLL